MLALPSHPTPAQVEHKYGVIIVIQLYCVLRTVSRSLSHYILMAHLPPTHHSCRLKSTVASDNVPLNVNAITTTLEGEEGRHARHMCTHTCMMHASDT